MMLPPLFHATGVITFLRVYEGDSIPLILFMFLRRQD